jgi:DNA mismatch repair ATPase MutS
VVPFDRRDDPVYRGFFHAGSTTVLTGHDDWTFDTEAASDLLTRHFKVHSLDGFGLRECPLGLRAAGAVLHYVGQALRRRVDHVRQLRVKRADDYMLLDEATVRNLDLVDGPASVLGCWTGRRRPWVRACCATGWFARGWTWPRSTAATTRWRIW